MLANHLLVLFSILFASCSSSEKTDGVKKEPTATSSSSSSSGISISTANAVPLYKDIHSACVVDIFFGRGQAPRDILSDPYFSFVKSFNFNSLQYSGGSTADHDHVVVGDTKISGGKGDGYNIRAEDLSARGEDISTALDGIGKTRFGKDFFNEYCALLDKLGIHGDIIANVQSGTLEELYWKIDRAHAKRVVFGMEQNLGSNAHDFPDGKVYKEKINKWIASVKQKYPGIICTADAAPIFSPKTRFVAWNDEIQGIAGEEARLYLWDKDFTQWEADMNTNLSIMNRGFSQTFPEWFGRFQKKFPGKKVSAWQWGLKPKSPIFNTMAGCMYIGKFYEFMIDYNKSHDNFIGYASFMSLKSLNRGDGETLNHADALQACGLLFKGNKRVLDMNVNGISGVSGVACEENGKYTLMLINESGNNVNVPGITIDNVAVSGKKFTITSVHASSLGSQSVSKETKTLSSIELKPYSISIVEF